MQANGAKAKQCNYSRGPQHVRSLSRSRSLTQPRGVDPQQQARDLPALRLRTSCNRLDTRLRNRSQRTQSKRLHCHRHNTRESGSDSNRSTGAYCLQSLSPETEWTGPTNANCVGKISTGECNDNQSKHTLRTGTPTRDSLRSFRRRQEWLGWMTTSVRCARVG